MADTGLTIKIGSTADTRGFDQATEGLHRSTEAARGFVDTLKLGVGIDLGGKLVESIREIPNLLREAVAEGVKFNAMMQTTQIAIAGAMKSVDSSLTFKEAQRQGGEALDYLINKSKQMGLDFEAVAETYKVNIPTMFQAGIHDPREMADTIILLNQVASSKGISGFQAQRDIIDLLNGQGERTILGKELTAQGVSNESIEKWKEQGILAEKLREKLAAIAEASAAMADTYDGNLNRLKTTWNQLLGDLSKPVFEELQQAFKELAAELDSPEGKKGLQELGYTIKDIVHNGVALTEWAVKNAGTLATMAEAAGVLGVALGAMKLGQIVIGLTGLGGALSKNTALWGTETSAIAANTAAKITNAEASATAAAAGGAGGAGKLRILANGLTAATPLAAQAAVAAGGAGGLARGAVAAETAVVGAAGAGFGASLTALAAAAGSAAVALGSIYATYEAGKGIMTGLHDHEIAQDIMAGKEKFGGYERQTLQDGAARISSVDDQNKVLAAIDTYKAGLIKASSSLGYWDGAKKKAIDQELEYAKVLERQVTQMSPDKMASNAAAKAAHDKELNDKAAAEKQAAEEEENRKANAKREETRKEADAERAAREENEKAAAMAKSASERGDYSTYAADRGAELKKQLAATPSLRDEEGWEGKYTAQEVDKRDKLRAALEQDIKQMAKAQEAADMETWKERSRREDELTRKKIDSLKEEERLAQAEADKRIAQIEASGGKESEIASRRKAVEDSIAKKRLDLENQIGVLEGESARARETRQTEYEAKQISRDHSGKSPEKDIPKDLSKYDVERDSSGKITKYIPSGPGMDTDVTKRSGYVELPETDRLAEFKARQSSFSTPLPLPTPAANSPATQMANSTPGTGGGAAASKLPDPSKAVADLQKSLQTTLQSLEKSLHDASEKTTSAGNSATAAAAALTKKIADLQAQIDRISRSS